MFCLNSDNVLKLRQAENWLRTITEEKTANKYSCLQNPLWKHLNGTFGKWIQFNTNFHANSNSAHQHVYVFECGTINMLTHAVSTFHLPWVLFNQSNLLLQNICPMRWHKTEGFGDQCAILAVLCSIGYTFFISNFLLDLLIHFFSYKTSKF